MAGLIEWNKSLSLDIAEIDAQHQQLVKLINDLHTAMIERKPRESLGEIIDGLIAYTKSHFATEEKYFIEFGYNESVAHKVLHKEFVNKVATFKKDFEGQKIMLSMEVMGFLKDWLIEHIMGQDRKYAPLFKSKGLG
jgi:hemerythrin